MPGLLRHVPAVFQELVIELSGFQLARELAGYCPDNGSELVRQPLVGGLLEGDVLQAGCGAPRVNVREESPCLMLAHVHAGQAHELAVVVAGIDHLRLNQ